jgi:ankyrin repeat protein
MSSGEAVDQLRPIIDIEDWVEEQNFEPVHLAATGLSGTSLEEVIKLNPESIDSVDALGRTALTWAAARGDHRAVATLLTHGADPNLIDSYLGGPLSYAADRGHVACVRRLLEAGAETDPILPGGQITGSPLNCAARNSTDPLVIKTLLDFGADTESCGIDGKTSLIHVARTDNLEFALLFLEYGANINAVSAARQTPLTTAVIHNSHRVLRLLLERWEDYFVCPRLRGPHLIDTAAQYGDVETLKILAAADHFRLQYDEKYSVAKCFELLRERFDHDDELHEAMLSLISIIQSKGTGDEDKDQLLESGLMNSLISEKSSELNSDAGFEDALEHIHDT